MIYLSTKRYHESILQMDIFNINIFLREQRQNANQMAIILIVIEKIFLSDNVSF
jgi:hypothetical protein